MTPDISQQLRKERSMLETSIPEIDITSCQISNAYILSKCLPICEYRQQVPITIHSRSIQVSSHYTKRTSSLSQTYNMMSCSTQSEPCNIISSSIEQQPSSTYIYTYQLLQQQGCLVSKRSQKPAHTHTTAKDG